jgi:hypothetical protein
MDHPVHVCSKFYKACTVALAIPPNTKKVYARHLTDHLVVIILRWLHHCGAFNPFIPFKEQQDRLIQFLAMTPPPPYPPIYLVRHYLCILLESHKLKRSIDNSIDNSIRQKRLQKNTYEPVLKLESESILKSESESESESNDHHRIHSPISKIDSYCPPKQQPSITTTTTPPPEFSEWLRFYEIGPKTGSLIVHAAFGKMMTSPV